MITRQQVAEQALKTPHPAAPTDLAVGDRVAFTNDYGVTFDGLTVVGFADPGENGGRSVYLDYDCYWFPAKTSSLARSQG